MNKYMFVIPSLANGGAERVVSVIASGMAEKGYETIILRYYKTDNDYSVNKKVKVITLFESKDEYDKISKIKRFKRIYNVFKETNPKHIIPFLRYVNLQVVLSAGKFFNRIIYTVRIYPDQKGINAKLHRFLINHTNMTIVQNKEQKDFFAKSAHKRIKILFNPVDERFLNTVRNIETESFIVVSAGRLTEQKNFPLLIKAFARFAELKKDVCLNIYGVGEELNSLKTLVDSLGCQEIIKLMGRENNLEIIYTNANLFVMSSDLEGMPNALLEAMAAGVPCISTDCKSGPKEMIENEVNGLLIPTGDEEALLNAMNFMYNHRDEAEKMGKKAKKIVVDNYRTEKIVDEFLRIIEE